MNSSMLEMIIIGYLAGSIPTAYLVGKLFYNINIFEHGSKNMGATNVFRVLGSKAFAITLLCDMLKGMIPVLLLPLHFSHSYNEIVFSRIVISISAIIGHTLSPWVGFKGGKGVATGFGCFMAIAPASAFSSAIIFIIVLSLSKFVSLSSIIASSFLPIFILFYAEPSYEYSFKLAAFAFLVSLFIIYKHKSNIIRLIHGTELSIKINKNNP